MSYMGEFRLKRLFFKYKKKLAKDGRYEYRERDIKCQRSVKPYNTKEVQHIYHSGHKGLTLRWRMRKRVYFMSTFCYKDFAKVHEYEYKYWIKKKKYTKWVK